MTGQDAEPGVSGVSSRQLKSQARRAAEQDSLITSSKRRQADATSQQDVSLGKRPRPEPEDETCQISDTQGWEDQENSRLQVSKATAALPASVSVIQHVQQASKACSSLLNPIYTLVQSGQHLVQQLVPLAANPQQHQEHVPGCTQQQQHHHHCEQQQQQRWPDEEVALTCSSLVTASSGDPSSGPATAAAVVTASASVSGAAAACCSEQEATCISPSGAAAAAAAGGADQMEASTGSGCQHQQQQLDAAAIAAAAACAAGAATAAADMDAEEEEEDDEELLDPFVFISRLPPLEQCVSAKRSQLLPRKTRNCKQKTLVLDLDETLVHSTLDAAQGVGADFNFPVYFNGAEHLVYVRQRPHVSLFLERVAAAFEVVVFTASQKVYAERLLNILDPKRNLIRHRIYRDSCVLVEGNYLKDLSVLGRDLAATAIVDNSPQAFGFQLDNGIPIESWYEDKEDQELLRLLPFLEELAEVDDVRPHIQARYRMRERVAASAAAMLSAAVAQTGAAVGSLLPQAPVVRLMEAVPQAQAQQA